MKKINKIFLTMLLMSGCVTTLSTAISVSYSYNNVNTVEVDAAYTSNPGTYYDNLDISKQGTAFRTDLASLITSTHKTYTSYDQLKTLFNTTDKDPKTNSGMLWFYTGTKLSSYSGISNREHVWPKDGGDAFPEKSGPGSDAHHLRPTDSQLNSTRGSLSFDEVSQSATNIVKENGSTSYGTAPDGLCYKSGSFFYPAKGYRGATARILMYVQTRWGNQYNLKFVDNAGNSKTIGKISTLLKWHIQEPPDEKEFLRNEEVYKIQGNRNPFIDHPEYASKIYCYDNESYNNALQNVVATYGDYGNVDVTSMTINPNGVTIEAGNTRQFSISTITPENASKSVTWTSSNPEVATIDKNGLATGVGAGKTTITATSTVTPSVKATATLNVTAAKILTHIEVSGTPKQTSYYEGDTFNPDGLTVTAHYDDNSSANVALSSCTFKDGVTGLTTLSTGTTTINVSYAGKTATITGINVFSKPVVDTGTYKLVTNASQLVAGSKVIIANKANNVAAGALFSTYLSKVSATFTNDTITSNDALEFTLGKSGSYYTFTYNNTLLGCSGEKKLAFSGGTTTWSITVNTDGTSNVAPSTGASTSGTLQYNSGAPRFTTYKSSQQPIQLYVAGQSASYSSLDDVLTALKMDLYNNEEVRPSGDCSTDFALARNLILSLSPEDLNTFKTSSTYKAALDRYLAWANALNENPWSFQPKSSILFASKYDNDLFINIIIISLITLSSGIITLILIKYNKRRFH